MPMRNLVSLAVLVIAGPVLHAQQVQELTSLNGHRDTVIALVFAPDGKTLITAGQWGDVKAWNIATGKELVGFEDHGVQSIALTKDGDRLVTGSRDKTLKVWDVNSRKLVFTLKGHTHSVEGIALSPDGRTIASVSNDSIRLWCAQCGAEQAVFIPMKESRPKCVAFSPNGKVVASGDGNHRINFWDVDTGKVVSTLVEHEDGVGQLAFSPDGNTLVSGSYDLTVGVWELSSGKLKGKLKGHGEPYSVAISPDGRYVAVGDEGKQVTIWDLMALQEVARLQAGEGIVFAVAFSRDGKTLAAGTSGRDHRGQIQLWDVSALLKPKGK